MSTKKGGGEHTPLLAPTAHAIDEQNLAMQFPCGMHYSEWRPAHSVDERIPQNEHLLNQSPPTPQTTTADRISANHDNPPQKKKKNTTKREREKNLHIVCQTRQCHFLSNKLLSLRSQFLNGLLLSQQVLLQLHAVIRNLLTTALQLVQLANMNVPL